MHALYQRLERWGVPVDWAARTIEFEKCTNRSGPTGCQHSEAAVELNTVLPALVRACSLLDASTRELLSSAGGAASVLMGYEKERDGLLGDTRNESQRVAALLLSSHYEHLRPDGVLVTSELRARVRADLLTQLERHPDVCRKALLDMYGAPRSLFPTGAVDEDAELVTELTDAEEIAVEALWGRVPGTRMLQAPKGFAELYASCYLPGVDDDEAPNVAARNGATDREVETAAALYEAGDATLEECLAMARAIEQVPA